MVPVEQGNRTYNYHHHLAITTADLALCVLVTSLPAWHDSDHWRHEQFDVRWTEAMTHVVVRMERIWKHMYNISDIVTVVAIAG